VRAVNQDVGADGQVGAGTLAGVQSVGDVAAEEDAAGAAQGLVAAVEADVAEVAAAAADLQDGAVAQGQATGDAHVGEVGRRRVEDAVERDAVLEQSPGGGGDQCVAARGRHGAAVNGAAQEPPRPG